MNMSRPVTARLGWPVPKKSLRGKFFAYEVITGNDPVNNLDPWGLLDGPATNLPVLSTCDLLKINDFLTIALPGGSANYRMVEHYFKGNGEEASLSKMGALTLVQNLLKEEINNAVKEFQSSKKCGDKKTVSKYATLDIFTLGKTSVNLEEKCEGGTCIVTAKYDDPFLDPFDIWEKIKHPSLPDQPVEGAWYNQKKAKEYGDKNRWDPKWNPCGKPYQVKDNWWVASYKKECCK